jgi:hypothetical protein
VTQQPPENQGPVVFLDDMLRRPGAIDLNTVVGATPMNIVRPITPGMFRMVIDLPVEVAQVIDQMVRRNGISHAEAVRRSIVTANFMEDRLSYGTTILMEEPDGRLLRMRRRTGVPAEEQSGPTRVAGRLARPQAPRRLFRRRGQ